MNIKSRLEHIAHMLIKDRQMGNTTMTAKAAIATGGMVIARNHEQAKQIERTHKVTARSMEVNLEGFAGPFFLDHFAASGLLISAANNIEALEKERDLVRREKEELQQKLDNIQAILLGSR